MCLALPLKALLGPVLLFKLSKQRQIILVLHLAMHLFYQIFVNKKLQIQVSNYFSVIFLTMSAFVNIIEDF